MRVAEHEESGRKDGQETEPGGSYQARSESYGGEVLPDPVCPWVCVIQRPQKSPRRLGFQELIVEGMRMS